VRAMRDEPWRRERLGQLRRQLAEGVQRLQLPWRLMPSDTPIQPLLVGHNADAMRLMAALGDRGVWVPAIRPPTVPEGTARLRISLSAAHSPAQVDRLLAALADSAQSWAQGPG
jgi:8-amino-7-oxononanoate synthase